MSNQWQSACSVNNSDDMGQIISDIFSILILSPTEVEAFCAMKILQSIESFIAKKMLT